MNRENFFSILTACANTDKIKTRLGGDALSTNFAWLKFIERCYKIWNKFQNKPTKCRFHTPGKFRGQKNGKLMSFQLASGPKPADARSGWLQRRSIGKNKCERKNGPLSHANLGNRTVSWPWTVKEIRDECTSDNSAVCYVWMPDRELVMHVPIRENRITSELHAGLWVKLTTSTLRKQPVK